MLQDVIIRAWIGFFRRVLPGDYDFVRAETAVGVGAVRPKGKFVTVKLISGPDGYSIDQVRQMNEREKLELVSADSYAISVQAYRENALDAMMAIKMQLENPDHIDFLRDQAGISVTVRGAVNDLSQQFDTGFEERFQMDISFAVGWTAQTDIGIIESASIKQEQIDG